ncbi:EamA-like transporter family protein [Cognatiyoonia koreensis]|uniref:EamA-like transporter family protein n=1 Tax=Cognatiyoonia koreensis TaxID=364200 RepID=A0A1I0N3R9_9RHOB|nr:DMT family transporter [Cognatiyoonia koreensis]SEV95732.1 EamA-like transporter family protein [Cognatiyoonia koreensis]
MRQVNPPLAIVFMLTATAFIAATMMLAKLLGGDHLGPALHPLQITHGRFVFAFMAISTALAVLRPRFGPIHWKLHAGRTSFGACGVTCMFAAVAFIPLPDATAISFLNPVFGMLLAIPFLGERVGPWRVFAALMAFAGAMILLRPGSGVLQIGGLIALGSAAFLGAELIFIKKLSNVENPLQILFINNALGVMIASLAVLPVWTMPTAEQWVALIALGVLMACAQACFVNAMARAEASFVTPFSYMTLLFAALYDLLVFDVIPDAVSWLGAGVIVTGALILAWRERRTRP